jgi:hypothetical protein
LKVSFKEEREGQGKEKVKREGRVRGKDEGGETLIIISTPGHWTASTRLRRTQRRPP